MFGLTDRFRRRHTPEGTIKERIKKLEERADKLENASYVMIEIGGNKGFFSSNVFVEVNKILQELIEKSGYELTYKQEIEKRTCLKKKPSKK